MKHTKGDKFNFFIPASFEKSGETGELFIKGIASSEEKDSDGEFLDPSGFDYQPLLDNGYFNWNHQAQKSPGAILGKPTKAKITPDNQFYVEGFLYKGHKDAQDLYNLAQILENEDPDRRLGFSIEGQATERDPINPKRVRKARITGVAITHCPKNPNTLLSIMKGEYSEPFVDLEEVSRDELSKSVHDIEALCSEFNTWNSGQVKPTFRSVIEFLQNNHEDYTHNDELVKTMCENLNKSMSTSNIPMPESVEGKPKHMVEDDKVNDTNKGLSKSEVFTYIFHNITKVPSVAEETYNLINTISNTMNNEEITLGTIKKAQEILELAKSSTTTTEGLEKSTTSTELDSKVNGGEIETLVKSMLEKGMSQTEIESSLKESGHEPSTYQEAVSALCAAYSADKNGGTITPATATEFKKAEETTPADSLESKFQEVSELQKSLFNEFSTKSEDNINSLKSLIKSQNELLSAQTDLLRKSFEQSLNLTSEFEGLKKSFEETQQELEKISTTPQPAKSVRKVIERFPEGTTPNGSSFQGQTYDIAKSQDRSNLVDFLFSQVEIARTRGQKNETFEKAIQDLEITKSFPNSALPLLNSLGVNVISSSSN